MSDESRLERSRQWFDAAINDLIAAKTLMDHGMFAHACFLSQQSAEKGMKGFIAIEQNPARSHSLGELLSALPQDARLIDLEPSRLDRFYIGTRYPESLPEGASIQKSFGKRDALDAISTAEGTVLLLASWAKMLGVNITENQTIPKPGETLQAATAFAQELEHDFHNGTLPRLDAHSVITGTVRALVKDANMNAFALVTAPDTDGKAAACKAFAVPVSDTDRDRLAVGDAATFEVAAGTKHCALVTPWPRTDAPKDLSPDAPGF